MMDMNIAIAGATASGKTALSVELALRNNMSIISADVMQSYRYMDIGTAKVTPEETKGIEHYMVDKYDPKEDVNIAVFCEDALKAREEIVSQGKTPLFVGGSGLYMDSMLYSSYDYSADCPEDEHYRSYLEDLAKKNGNEYVHNMLMQVDEVYASNTHPNNLKRVIRALEVYHLSGIRKSDMVKEKSFRHKTYYFTVNMDREVLYERINRRVDIMVQNGLFEEVRHLMNIGCDLSHNSMQAIGYKQVIEMFEGKLTEKECVEKIKQLSRNYAKRQMTWFNKNKDIIRIDVGKFGGIAEICEYMEGIIYEN
ncbi:MAG: tRNA (adenosine(37)-N6)-dimethylallyltransferase MiaA [Anaerofustis stercorihominis]|nr:tRNA (adenosine(37)-N6)-dimethylallyltransferase MiaA [Anaerofustis stercorihominis]